MKRYTLSPYYEYDTLEPYIDAKTMEIHHTKHNATYIEKDPETSLSRHKSGFRMTHC